MRKRVYESSVYFMKMIVVVFSYGLVLTQCESQNNSNQALSKKLVYELSEVDHTLPNTQPEKGIKIIKVIRTEADKHHLDFPMGKSELSLAYIYQSLHDNPNLLKHALLAHKILKEYTFSSVDEELTYVESLRLVGLGYLQSGHLEEALEYTQKALAILNKIEGSDKSYIIKGLVYQLQADIYKKSEQDELQYYNINKALECFNKGKDSIWYEHLMANVYNDFADFYMNHDKPDLDLNLSLLYIEKSLEISEKTQNPYAKGKSYKLLGDLYFLKGNYTEALEYYKKGEALFSLSKKPIDKVDILYKIATIYDKMEDDLSEKQYRVQYLELNDSIKSAKIDLQLLVSRHINEKAQKSISYYKGQIILFSSLLIVILILTFVFWKKKKKEIKRFKEEIFNKNETINSQKLIKNQLRDEIDQLKTRNIGKLKELLAKRDDRIFLAKFEEIYPTFIQKLKEHSDSLTFSDIKFCALVKLNFSTKEIADINYVTIKAIEIKRYRIRKKINLDPKINFETWILSLNHDGDFTSPQHFTSTKN